MTEVGSWRDRAACRDLVTADYDPFFADTNEGTQAAIAICATCPGHPNASKTRCKRGHPFDAHNTYYAPDGQRRCRTCLREAQPVRALEGGGSDAA